MHNLNGALFLKDSFLSLSLLSSSPSTVVVSFTTIKKETRKKKATRKMYLGKKNMQHYSHINLDHVMHQDGRCAFQMNML